MAPAVPALADWFTKYLSQNQIQSLDDDWLRATIELDLLDKVSVTVLAQTILGSNPQFAPDMAKDAEQIILRSREQGRDEQLAAALESQILQPNNFGGMQTIVYPPPIAPLADLLVQSASDRNSLASFLETRLNSLRPSQDQGIVLDRFGGIATAPKISDDQVEFLKDLILRLREAR